MKFLSTLLILFVFCVSSFAQVEKEAKPKYIVHKLDRNVNSFYDDVKPVITPDGLRMYYYITNHPDNTHGKDGSQDIWYVERESLDKEWKEKVHMKAPFNDHEYNAVLSVHQDGNALLLKGGKRKNDMNTFSMIRKSGSGWGNLTELEVEDLDRMNNGRFFGAFMSYDEKVLFIYMSEVKDQINSDIYVSFPKDATHWTTPKKLGAPINVYQDDFGPYLTKDNSYLYFCSGRPGGLGDIDIYRSKRLDGTYLKWGELENLGAPVNTRGFDAYFTMEETGQNLYVTRSYKTLDGGSLDILGFSPRPPEILVKGTVADQASDESVQAFILINGPEESQINTRSSVYGEYDTELGKEGVFTFNVSADKYKPATATVDIKNIKEDTTLVVNFKMQKIAALINLSGLISKEGTGDPVAADIRIIHNGKTVKSLKASADFGEYDVNLSEPGQYEIYAQAEGYLNATDSIVIEKSNEDQFLTKNLEMKALEVGTTVRLEKIYFDFDKSTLRSESFPELNKVVEMMNNNQGLEIEISGHTDSKGSDDYNLTLSQGRADAVRAYVIENGIDGNRITSVGYGETKPETTNDTEEGRQINRRVEFTILKN